MRAHLQQLQKSKIRMDGQIIKMEDNDKQVTKDNARIKTKTNWSKKTCRSYLKVTCGLTKKGHVNLKCIY